MWSVKCEVWSVKFEVWSAKSAVCSVRCGVSREGHGRDRLSLNYRSFMFGKLPPPACPGLCYLYNIDMICIYIYLYTFLHTPRVRSSLKTLGITYFGHSWSSISDG